MGKRYETMSDENLLDFIAAQDTKAFTILVERYHRRFTQMTYRWVLNQEDAQELVQEAFLKLWTGKASYKRDAKARFTTWFYTILYRQAVDRLRARSSHFVPLNEQMSEHIEDAQASTEETLANRQTQLQLQQQLMQLSPSQRAAIQLFYFEELKQKDIASILGISVKALESQLTRAKAQLREGLAPYKEELDYVANA
jgi:RNA polymerase sigma-70 factor, ECF subfamily